MNILFHKTSKVTLATAKPKGSNIVIAPLSLPPCHQPCQLLLHPVSAFLSILASFSPTVMYTLSLSQGVWPRKKFHTHIVLAHDSNGWQTPCIREIFNLMRILWLLVFRPCLITMDAKLAHYWSGLSHTLVLQTAHTLWLTVSQEPNEMGGRQFLHRKKEWADNKSKYELHFPHAYLTQTQTISKVPPPDICPTNVCPTNV